MDLFSTLLWDSYTCELRIFSLFLILCMFFSTFQGFGGLQFYSGHGFAIAAAFTIWLLLTMKYCRRRRGRDDWSPSLMNKVISWKILWWHVKYMCIALSPNWNREVRTNASVAHILFQTFIILPFLAITHLLPLQMNRLIIAKCLIINPTSMNDTTFWQIGEIKRWENDLMMPCKTLHITSKVHTYIRDHKF